MKKIVAHDATQQLIEEQQETMTLMRKETEENFKRLVKENEGIDDPRFSPIYTSQPVPQEHRVCDRLAGSQNQMGSMAPPSDPDTQIKELGEEAPKQYEKILKETDVEQQPFIYPVEEDALQQQIFENDYDQNRPAQYTQSAPTQQKYIDNFSEIASLREEEREIVNQNRYKNKYGQQPFYPLSQFQKNQMQQVRAEDQMSENLQAANDEVINGLKYLVGSTGWGKQPINAYFNRQHFPDRTFQWYTNEGQTVLRQVKVKLSQQQLLNIPAKKKNYIKTKEIEKSLKAQKQLRKK
ncbi:MAG: hypothetical protein EZS28_025849 [Streblomastix strix]|uniref:Uncharacterized protein n=1 Tax=Streblomastix strix TaxID=222440 RepID=A0A5J4V7W9_9EUKA|nr:MAG: hypothetical protein EZS28_025849 [Streblomastix strix]